MPWGSRFGLGGLVGGLLLRGLFELAKRALESEFRAPPHTTPDEEEWARQRSRMHEKTHFSLSARPLQKFPRSFIMQQVPLLYADPTASPSGEEVGIALDLASSDDGHYMGRIDQFHAGPHALNYYHPDGQQAVRAERTYIYLNNYTSSSSRTQGMPGMSGMSGSQEGKLDAFGEVITVKDLYTKKVLARIVERGPFRNELFQWMNYLTTRYMIFNGKGEEELIVKKRNGMMFGTYFSVFDKSQPKEKVASFSTGPKLFDWSFEWKFQTRLEGPEEAWKREMQKSQPTTIHPICYAILAGFHTFDVKRLSARPKPHEHIT